MSIKFFIRDTFRSCLDILRDSECLIGDKALRQLVYFLQLRLLESKFGKEIDIDNYPYNFSEYEFPEIHRAKVLALTRFSYLAKEVKEDDIVNNMKYLWDDILSVHPMTKHVFLKGRGFEIKRQSTYKKIIDKLALVEFEKIDEDILGEVYEEVIKGVMTGKTLGQFFTPSIVKEMMVDLINPQIKHDGTTESIFDPAMGTGGFLITCLRNLIRKSKESGIKLNWEFLTRNAIISGREYEPDTFQLAMSNMLISSGNMFPLENGDSIHNPITAKYEIIIANPPFGISGLEYDEITSPLRNAYMPIHTKSSTPLFIQAIIYMLKINGRCAVVLPDGKDLFSKTKSLVAVREYLMKTCELKEVIYLPSGTFTYTSIKTCVFYFHKKKEGSEVIELKIKRSDDKETDRSYVFTQEHQTNKVIFSDFDGVTKKFIIETGIDEIAQNNYSLNYAEYLEKKKITCSSSNIVVKTLGEICKDMSSNKNIPSSERVSGDYKFFTCSPDVGSHNAYFYEGSFIIQGSRGTIVGSTHSTVDHDKFAIGTSMFISKVIDVDAVLTKYVYYYLKLNPSLFRQHINGTAIPMINKANYYSIRIPIHPIEKQREIVDRLDFIIETSLRTSCQKIAELQRLNELCFQTHIVCQAPIKTLGEVCKFDIGGTPSRRVAEYYENGTNVWVSVSELNGGYIYNSKEKITDAGVQNSSVKLFVKDTVLFSFKLSIGKTAIVGNPLYTNEAIAGIFSKNQESLSNKYVYHYLSNNDFTKHATGLLGNGSLNKKSLAEIPIPIPSPEQQKEIVEFCEANCLLIKQLENEIEQNERFAQMLIQETRKRKHSETI